MDQNWTAILLPLFFGGIFGAVGIGMLVFGQIQRNKARETEKWPTTNGTIVTSRIEQQTRIERDEGRSYSRTTNTPIVEYTYEVDGKALRGNKIFPGATMSYDIGTTQGIINRYQVGQPATVHYNPADPTQAVLETKAKGGSIMLILGAVFAAIGIIACCVAAGMALLR